MNLKPLLPLALCLICSTSFAHPHRWVNLTTDFVINETEQLIEVRQRWIFDELYSAYTLADLRAGYGDELDEGLAELGNQMVNNMLAVRYFSHLLVGEENVDLVRPSKHHLTAVKVNDVEVMILEMHFPIPAQSLNARPISWSVYDPEYYVDMRHERVDNIRLVNNSTMECSPELQEGEPTKEQIQYAASLDKNQQASDGLGKYFAETVRLECF